MMHTRTTSSAALLARPAFAALSLLAALLLCLAPAAQAQTAGDGSSSDTASAERQAQIRQLLEERDAEIKAILGTEGSFTEAQRQELKALVNGLIDFRAMGRSALGPHWKTLSYDQQTEFVGVFSEIVKEQSLADLAPYRAPVSYEEIRVTGDSAYVRTTSTQQGERIPVVYDLIYRESSGSDSSNAGGDGSSGEWRARDIVVDEVSTVEGYQRSFRSVIRRHGYDALMKSLRKKLDDVQTSASG